MIVYLIGHGFVAPHFPQIQIDGIDDLKFYVPEGQLPEDYRAEHPDAPEEEIRREVNNRQNASLYNGGRTYALIRDDGNVGNGEVVEIHARGDEIHEHLLHGLNAREIVEDLRGVTTRPLDLFGHWNGVIFRVMEITEVNRIVKEYQYIVTIPPRPLFADVPEDNNVYKLSWLIEKIRNLKEVDLGLPADEPLQICWLACRFAMGGANNDEFMYVYHHPAVQNEGRDNVIIEGVFPPM